MLQWSRRRILLAVLFLALAAWAVWLFGSSGPFGDCIHKRKNYQAYKALHEEALFPVKLGVRVNLHAACFVHVTRPCGRNP
jgi:hypothetical protein